MAAHAAKQQLVDRYKDRYFNFAKAHLGAIIMILIDDFGRDNKEVIREVPPAELAIQAHFDYSPYFAIPVGGWTTLMEKANEYLEGRRQIALAAGEAIPIGADFQELREVKRILNAEALEGLQRKNANEEWLLLRVSSTRDVYQFNMRISE